MGQGISQILVIAREIDLGSRRTPPPNFTGANYLWGRGGGMAKVMSCLKLNSEIYEMIFFSIVLGYCNTLFSQTDTMSG